MGYEIIELGIDRPVHQLERAEAERVYKLRVGGMADRIAQLAGALKEDGIDLEWAPEFLRKLDEWFRWVIEESRKLDKRPPAVVLSLANDIALFVGEMIRKASPQITWSFLTTDKHELGYHKHVLVGFEKVENPNYYIDIDSLIGSYAQRVFSGTENRQQYLETLYNTAVRRA